MIQQIVYLGCFNGRGQVAIKVAQFDSQTGKLNEVNTISTLTNTRFLAATKDKKKLLSVSEEGAEGYLDCFDINNPCAPLFINQQHTLGGAPCHISLTHEKAFISNYSTGNLSAFSLTEQQLSPAYTSVQHHGRSAHPERQSSAHIHSSCISVDGHCLVVADLGIDAVKVYRITQSQLNLLFTAKLAAGDGPRHLAFNPQGDKLYLGNELSSEVVVFDFNAQTGELLQLQRISCLPTDMAGGENKVAELTLSKDGAYLYVSNRGHDSISTFCIDAQSGLLTVLDYVKTGGVFPRHFAISPDQKWVLVAHQYSDYLSVFKRDSASGLLTKTENQLAVKDALCVCFL